MDPKLQAVKDEHGRATVLRDDAEGVLFAFKPANHTQISDIQAQLGKDKETNAGRGAIQLISGFCSFLIVLGSKDEFLDYARKYPLKIIGDDENGGMGVFSSIFSMAQGEATVEVI